MDQGGHLVGSFFNLESFFSSGSLKTRVVSVVTTGSDGDAS